MTDTFTVKIRSCGLKHNDPDPADMVIDVRELANPYWVDELRPYDGLNRRVSDYVLTAEGAEKLIEQSVTAIQSTKRQLQSRGATEMKVVFTCTGGRHRSVAVSEEVGRRLNAAGVSAVVSHRDRTLL